MVSPAADNSYNKLTSTRSSDGMTLVMSSSDGFCSSLSFASGELGNPYQGPHPIKQHRLSVVSASSHNNPLTPQQPPPLLKHPSNFGIAQSPSHGARPASPTRTNSASSIATMASFAQPPAGMVISNPIPTFGHLPSLSASATYAGGALPIPSPTPPMTPLPSSANSFVTANLHAKREGEEPATGDKQEPKKRRIAPTLVSNETQGT